MIGSRAAGLRDTGRIESSRIEAGRAFMWVARTALYLAVAVSAGARGGGDASFVRLLANGRAILTGHGSFDRLDVLASVAYAAAERAGGAAGVAAFGALCAIAMLVLVEAQARARGARPGWSLAAAAGAAVLSIGTLSADGGSFAWLWAAAFGYTLAGTDRRRWIFAVLLAWAWGASSWLAIAAPLVALAAALGRRGDRTLLAIAAGSALALLATPAGLGLPREAFAHLSLGGAAATALVWQPNAVSSPAYKFGLIPLVIALVWFGLPRLADWAPVAAVLIFALAAGAAMPLAGIVILPSLVSAAGPSGAGEPSGRRAFAWRALGVSLPCALFAPLMVTLHAQAGTAPALPVALVERLAAEHSGRTVVLCRPEEWCALVDALGRSDLRAFASDRIGVLDERQLRDQVSIVRVRAGWRAAIARNGIDAILVANGEALATILALQPDWHAVPSGSHGNATLFLRAEQALR